MPNYRVRDPRTGRTVTLRGDSPPTEAELEQIFAQVTPAPTPRSSGGVVDVAKGVGQSVAGGLIGLGEMMAVPMRAIPGVRDIVATPEEFSAAREAWATPENTTQQVSKTAGDVAQFFLPVGAAGKAKTAAEIGKAALLTRAQGGTTGQAALSAGMTAVVPGAGAVMKAGRAVKASAHPLVRAAIKPTVTSLKRISGGGGLDAKAERLVTFIVDNRLTTATKARDLFTRTERELQTILAKSPKGTDAATRASRYLTALERSAAKQGLPADDIATIRNAAAELLEGPMGDDVVTMVMKPHPSLLNAQGKPLQVLTPQTTRQLRTSVPADEALSSARSSSRWSTNKQWGEQKGTAVEAQKAVERAQRDAVKVAVPEARELLGRESLAIKSEEVLDRMAQRAGNRDAVSLPAHVIAAGEIASGRVPFLAAAANWLRDNQMKAGIWADRLGQAIEQGNAPRVAEILKRLGVATTAQARPAPATP